MLSSDVSYCQMIPGFDSWWYRIIFISALIILFNIACWGQATAQIHKKDLSKSGNDLHTRVFHYFVMNAGLLADVL